MQLRKRQSKQQNVLIYIPVSMTSYRIELMVYKEMLDLEEHVWSQFPQASSILYLPQTVLGSQSP